MGLRDRFFRAGGDSRTVRCAGCGRGMLIISNAFVRSEMMMRSQGCFRCAACGRYTCYGCSDNREPCQCGAQRWEQWTYVTE
jgi:hypothetical protein